MVRTLNSITPADANERRAKLLVSGKPGVGKTWVAMDFPNAYYIDVEGGATQPHYKEKLIASNAMYFGVEQGSQDFECVIEEVITLATVEHDRKTLIIDSVTKLYHTAAGIAEERVGNEFGKHMKEAQKPLKRLLRWLDKVDMNVILIAHEKDKWGKQSNGENGMIGLTFDCWDKLEYELDFWIQVFKEGPRYRGLIKKSRLLEFPQGDSINWNYAEFANTFGIDTIEAAPRVIVLATADQIQTLKTLVAQFNAIVDDPVTAITESKQKAWLTRANAGSFEEFTDEQITKLIEMMQTKLEKKATV